MTTPEQYAAAVETLSPDDISKDGVPKMKALNAALIAAGLEPIDAKERDALREAPEMARDKMLDAGEDITAEATAKATDRRDRIVEVTVLQAFCDPVPLHVHGTGSFRLKVGEANDLPFNAIDALMQSNCQISWNEKEPKNA